MGELITDVSQNIETWILALAASPWIYVALLCLATIDGFFPPVPSESVVITLAVAASTTGSPHMAGVFVVAAVGAWTGDQIAYAIGRAVGTDRVPFLRGPRGQRAVAWARQALSARGASFILAARYVPIGRVAVNFSAGALGYRRHSFMAISGVAGLTWAAYSVAIGLAAASWLGHRPLLAMAIGIVIGIASGFVLDQVLGRLALRRGGPTRTGEQPEVEGILTDDAGSDRERVA
ncbi:membrane protein [Flavimobilis marinus]|uniref:Membrane protein DedA, SNARE-associated domain n=1 Tax=Flavimobilis marinus TaxID=285351 RepID=A0A1I2D8C0_9MICO|nr:DedA family protein [Flavimobilis marinus]GHG45786.1 membrane protein [Flavimobilis marinus]SFE76786.1 membrane protein DedA, SNARE-associated domain [Flavimobilis marinus]